MKICAHCTTTDWGRLETAFKSNPDDDEAWQKAISILECRIRERFLQPIDVLIQSELPRQMPDCKRHEPKGTTPGFAVMALCCLLIDTLQAFREGPTGEGEPPVSEACAYPASGKCVKEPSTGVVFKNFLTTSPHFRKDFGTRRLAGEFSQNVRNALLHSAETRKGWLIRSAYPPGRILMRDRNAFILNRTEFARALAKEFEDYIRTLRQAGDAQLRYNFLKKMKYIVSNAPATE